MSKTKICNLYYESSETDILKTTDPVPPLSNALIVMLSVSGNTMKQGDTFNPDLLSSDLLFITRHNVKSKPEINVWTMKESEKWEQTIKDVCRKLGLTEKFQLICNYYEMLELSDTDKMKKAFIENILNEVNNSSELKLRSIFCKTTLELDFWNFIKTKTSRRPGSYKSNNFEHFTFGVLKNMWKTINMSGFSNKSKADLFDGFTEKVSDMADTSDTATKLFSKFPTRMIAVPHYMESNNNEEQLSAEDTILLLSKISSSSLFDSKQSADIIEEQVVRPTMVLELVNPYDQENMEKADVDSEDSARDMLKKYMESTRKDK